MAGVEVWQPDDTPLNSPALSRFVEASKFIDEPMLGLSSVEIEKWASVMKRTAHEWASALTNESEPRLISLVKFFTLAEMRLPGWEAGARSPVIRIVAELRRRNAYPKDLTAWIKANSTNRFLPYGSLTERL